MTQTQIDELSVTNAHFFQGDGSNTLYMFGGYGYDTLAGKYDTKSTLTAIDIPGFVKWVKRKTTKSAAQSIRSVANPILQATGGELLQANPHQPYLNALGQNFIGT